jgi:GTPase SAR1 family protein
MKQQQQQLPIDLVGVIIEFSAHSFSQLATWQRVCKSASLWIDQNCHRTWARLLRIYFPHKYERFNQGKHCRERGFGELYLQLLKYEVRTNLLRDKFIHRKNMCLEKPIDPQTIKVSILGGSAVGKLTLAHRFCSFDMNSHERELSTNCYVHQLDRVFNVNVMLKERANADVFVIMYDLSDDNSLQYCFKQVRELQRSYLKQPLAMLVVGNKRDSPNRSVSCNRQEVTQNLVSMKLGYCYVMETSALHYEQVDEAFQQAIVLATKLKELDKNHRNSNASGNHCNSNTLSDKNYCSCDTAQEPPTITSHSTPIDNKQQGCAIL